MLMLYAGMIYDLRMISAKFEFTLRNWELWIYARHKSQNESPKVMTSLGIQSVYTLDLGFA